MTQLFTFDQVVDLVEKTWNSIDAHLDPALEGERNGEFMFLFGQIKHYQRPGNSATYKELAGIIFKAWLQDDISWNHFEVLMKTLKKDGAK